MVMELSDRIKHNAHKIAFVMQQYPEKKIPDITTLMAMPAVDINSALWAAEDMGLISTPNKETGELKFVAEPDGGWNFGQNVQDLKTALVYCMTVLARRETDLEEFFISKWTQGYPVLDVLVSMKSLLLAGVLTEYVIRDQRVDENGHKVFEQDEVTPALDDYIFYTLTENAAHKWGSKQFKETPTSVTEGQ